MKGWLINDCLTCIPGTKTFWHDLLDWFPELIDKTNGYTDYSVLATTIEEQLKMSKPDYIIRNGSYFRKINTDVKTISLIQDVAAGWDNQIDIINSSQVAVFNTNYVYQKYASSIANKNIRIIPLGVNFDFFKPIQEKHPDVLPNSVIYIGSSMNFPKGFNRLLNIIDSMTEQNFCLVMKDNFTLADIPEKNRSRVKVFNKVNAETVRLLINSSVCALCTSYEETQHLSGIECGACNVPIVATCVGVYFDCKDDSGWGCIANDDTFVEKINYVLNNKQLFSPREYFIKNYSIDSCKRAWIELVNTLG